MNKTMRTITLVLATTLLSAAGLWAQAAPESQSSSAAVGKVRADMARLMARLNSVQGGSGSVMVVSTAQMSMEDLAATTEDMTVMARILQGAAKQANPATSGFLGAAYGGGYASSYGESFFIGQSGRDAQSIYLQGYGALFTMKVGFPLSPGPQTEEPPQEKTETDVDPVWQQARQEIFSPEQPDAGGKIVEEGEKYSDEKVEGLKTDLITALKHAANMRNLSPDEAVVIVVMGRSIRNRIVSMNSLPGSGQSVAVDSRGATYRFEGGKLPDDIVKSVPPTALTIRAKRSDIDAFAKGDLKLEQFRQKVQVFTQPQLGEDAPSAMPPVITGYGSR